MALVLVPLAAVQFVLHYLGLAGIFFGVIACLVGNFGRGSELLLQGVGVLIAEHVLGFLVLGGVALVGRVARCFDA